MASMETPMQSETVEAHQDEEEQAGPMLLERLQVCMLSTSRTRLNEWAIVIYLV